MVTELHVDLNADDTMTLTLDFASGSIVVSSPLSLTGCPLDGTIAIRAPVQLVRAGASDQRVSLNMHAATTTITYSPAADHQ